MSGLPPLKSVKVDTDALLFYKARALFTEPAKEKPGLWPGVSVECGTRLDCHVSIRKLPNHLIEVQSETPQSNRPARAITLATTLTRPRRL
jgi:hypothetical protein